MARRKKKVVSVRAKRPINIDRVFFGAVAVYICVIVYMGLSSEHIAGYEVKAGTLSVNHTYEGIALRNEEVYYADTSGYVSYYARDGERVSGSSLVYTVDEKGEINELIQQNAESVDLSDENFSAIRSEVKSYLGDYSDKDFFEVYSFQPSVEGMVMDLLNQNMLESLEEAGENSMFSRIYSGGIGIVEYYTDGYEDMQVEALREKDLDKTAYQKENLKKEIIQTGDAVYKLATSEKWSLIVPITEEEYDSFLKEETQYMEVMFAKDRTTAWASFSLLYVETTPCARLDFNNSMVRFAGDRYVEVEFLIEDETGLKIPNTAVVEKEFYLIGKDYLIENPEGKGFLKQTFNENGELKIQFVGMTLYYEDEEYYYVDPKESDFATGELKLRGGDYLVKEDSGEQYLVAKTGMLQGVYNINKGYTQFRQVSILYQNEEYALVEEGTSYGLMVYDHIVLNGDTINEEEVVY